jgi:hypothetical protein
MLTKAQMKHLAAVVARSFERIHNANRTVGSELQLAIQCAEREEKQHRKSGRGLGTYSLPVRDTALLFVAKWFYLSPVDSVAKLAGCRGDVLHASIAWAAFPGEAFASEMEKWTDADWNLIERWDYSRDVAGVI